MSEHSDPHQAHNQRLTSEMLRLLSRLTEKGTRQAESRRLAQHLGADDLMVFLSNGESGPPTPAPGWPEIYPDGQHWDQFVDATRRSGFAQARIPFPMDEQSVPVTGIADGHALVFVLIGAHIDAHELNDLQLVLPLLTKALNGEQRDQQLTSDLADSTARTIETTRLYQASQDAGRARDEFLSIASHELRTPLTTVRGYIQILHRSLQNPQLDRKRVLKAVQHLDRQTRRIENLVSDLLDASRIREGKLELRTELMDLRAVTRRVITRITEANELSAGQQLWLDAPESVSGIWDPFRIEQVLSILISNALKYSPDGGDIDIVIQCDDEFARVIVRDTGMGISSEGLSRLFEPFQRDPNMKFKVGGTGLGLYICRQIIERHNGSLTVESQEDIGSTFTIQLPRRHHETE